MPFVTINGITLPNVTVEELPESIGEVGGRALIGNALRTRTARMRSWRLSTPILANTDARALRGLIEGNGQAWSFTEVGANGLTYATLLSSLGVTASVSGSFSAALTGGRSNGPRITVDSGSRFGVRLAQRMGIQRKAGWAPAVDGFTLMCWRSFNAGAEGGLTGFHHVLLKGKIDFAAGVATNPVGLLQYLDGVAGSYGFGEAFGVSASSPYVALHGRRTDASNGAVDFSDFVVLPFEVPASYVPVLYAQAVLRRYARLPRVLASGDFIDDVVPLEVLCEVRSQGQQMGNVDGNGPVATNRTLEIEMMETL